MNNAPAAASRGVMITLSDEELHDSPFNPRADYANLDELADSIRAVGGLLEPVLVRPRATLQNLARGDAGLDPVDGYEIVCGHRRRRACALVGIRVDCIVRAMSDAEAALAQMVENVQRENLNPFEEAAGFHRLIHVHGMKVDDVAAQVHRSRRRVYEYLTLLNLIEPARAAVLDKRIPIETALAIARVTGEGNQAKALQFALEQVHHDKSGYRTTVRELNERFTLDLAKSIFDTEDATLVPEAGACAACPRRSGNAPELFDDLLHDSDKQQPWQARVHLMRTGGQVCTDPDCYASKKAAHLQRKAEAERAAGAVVVTGNAAKQLLDARGELKDSCLTVTEARKFAKAAGLKEVPVVVVIDPRNGKSHKAVKRADLVKAGVKAAEAPAKAKGGNRAVAYAEQERQRKEREKTAEQRTAANIARLARLREAMRATPRSEFDLQLLAGFVFDAICGSQWDLRAAAANLGMSESDLHLQIAGHAETEPAELAELMLALVIGTSVQASPYRPDEPPELLDAACAHYGIEPDPPAAEATPTPSTAARAPKNAGKRRGKAKGETQEQNDDAGSAGGSAATGGELFH